jgi:hypothetical protein
MVLSSKKSKASYDINKSFAPVRNVLCLGMSYPAVMVLSKSMTKKEIKSSSLLAQAKKMVEESHFSEMNGRDFARVAMMEKACNVRGFCVSLEKGNGDKFLTGRHLTSDFNNKKFLLEVSKEFVVGPKRTPAKFCQVSVSYHDSYYVAFKISFLT